MRRGERGGVRGSRAGCAGESGAGSGEAGRGAPGGAGRGPGEQGGVPGEERDSVRRWGCALQGGSRVESTRPHGPCRGSRGGERGGGERRRWFHLRAKVGAEASGAGREHTPNRLPVSLTI